MTTARERSIYRALYRDAQQWLRESMNDSELEFFARRAHTTVARVKHAMCRQRARRIMRYWTA